MKIPQEVHRLVAELHSMGLTPYLVGGALRDLLLGIEPLDYDISFGGTVEQLEEIRTRHHTGRIDKRHGTLSMRLDGHKAEITLLRRESAYADARHPGSICFDATLEEDLLRRDFAVNSMAYDFSNREIIDPLGAQKDLATRPVVIRTTRSPGESFGEDALRMVRAFRLLGRVSLVCPAVFADDTQQALQANKAQVSGLRPEVVHHEMAKICWEPTAGDTFKWMNELGFLPVLFPAMKRPVMADKLHGLNTEDPLAVKMAIFARCVNLRPASLYTGLFYARKATERAEAIHAASKGLEMDDVVAAKSAFSLLKEEDRAYACRLYREFALERSAAYTRICEQGEALAIKDLALDAEALLAMGIKKRDIGKTLHWLLMQVYEDETRNETKKLTTLLDGKGVNHGKDAN